MELSRCYWPKADADMIAYHGTEWGTPVHDDRKLFEFMVLDAFQAGLSWSTILRKRENFRRAFADFDIEAIARFGDKDFERLINDAGIIRNRLKIHASIDNARAFLKIVESHGSFDAFIWQFTDGKTVTNHWTEEKQIPVTSPEAERMSAGLKASGFRFVGPTICYSFMQAAGIVNDHLVSCFRWKEVAGCSR
ncbi:MAG: DNA-3-methyladenine glycosylase I [Candidatus Neomarinimicrobiota bacterium]